MSFKFESSSKNLAFRFVYVYKYIEQFGQKKHTVSILYFTGTTHLSTHDDHVSGGLQVSQGNNKATFVCEGGMSTPQLDGEFGVFFLTQDGYLKVKIDGTDTKRQVSKGSL